MPRVFIPPQLRSLTASESVVSLNGETVRQLVDELEARYPGIRARLCEGDRLRPELSVAVDSRISPLGLLTRVSGESEVHFLPAVSGG